MDPGIIIAGLASAAGLGLGAGVGLRLLPIYWQARRDLREYKKTSEATLEEEVSELEDHRNRLASPAGRKRDSSIVGMLGPALRHVDGSYSRAYHVALEPTQFSDDFIVEARADYLARMLAVEKPPGTVLQFRLSVGPDPGRAILRHLGARDQDGVHPYAGLFHDLGVGHYQQAAATGGFKQSVLTLWVRVRVRHSTDARGRGVNNFLPGKSMAGRALPPRSPQAGRAARMTASPGA
jgi:hypothetical protein